jgi:hypothetical protein
MAETELRERMHKLLAAAASAVEFLAVMAKRGTPPSLPEAAAVVTELVQAVEGFGWSGADKKRVVLEALAELDARYGWRAWVLKTARIPGWARFVMPSLESAIVEVVVAVLNHVGGWWGTGPAAPPSRNLLELGLRPGESGGEG